MEQNKSEAESLFHVDGALLFGDVYDESSEGDVDVEWEDEEVYGKLRPQIKQMVPTRLVHQVTLESLY